jgi:hypothetical protein
MVMFLMAGACLACLTAVTSVSSQNSSTSTRLDSETAKQRELIKTLRQRIMKGDPSKPAFWRDVEELEKLGPPEFKIAVKSRLLVRRTITISTGRANDYNQW